MSVALRALPAPDPDVFSWPAVLRAAVLEEFQHEIYRPLPGDLVLFGPTCAISGCPGRGVNRSLGLKAKGKNRSTGTRFRGYVCLSHVEMWRRDGQPPIDAWCATPPVTGVTAARVSRQWLYGQPALRAQIEALRERPRQGVPARERSSEASLQQRLRGLLADNRALRDEVGALKAELALAYGAHRAPRPRDSDHAAAVTSAPGSSR